MDAYFRIAVLDDLEFEDPYVLWRVEPVEGSAKRLFCSARFSDGLEHQVRTNIGTESASAVARRVYALMFDWHKGQRVNAS